MDTKNHQVFLRIAQRTAKYYASRCWWAEIAELRNEAYISLVEFYADPPPAFDPSHAGALHYAGQVASRHNSRWLFKQSSPASGSSSAMRRDRLGATQRVGLGYDEAKFLQGDLESEIAMFEAQALVPALHAELRARLKAIFFAMFPDDDNAISEACIDVLAEDEKSSEAAVSHGVPVRSVYRRTERLKTRAIVDETVIDLVGQLREHRGFINGYNTNT